MRASRSSSSRGPEDAGQRRDAGLALAPASLTLVGLLAAFAAVGPAGGHVGHTVDLRQVEDGGGPLAAGRVVYLPALWHRLQRESLTAPPPLHGTETPKPPPSSTPTASPSPSTAVPRLTPTPTPLARVGPGVDPDRRYASCSQVVTVVSGGAVQSYSERYDASGNLTRRELDEDGDGSIDTVRDYRFDERQLLVAIDTSSAATGMALAVESFAYDAPGRMVAWRVDSDADGRDDVLIDYRYAEGGLQREILDSDGDGRPNRIRHYVYDGDGHLEKQIIDSDADGTDDVVTTYHWSDDRLTRRVRESSTGSLRDTQYLYDGASGRLLRAETDTDADGQPDEVEDYAYTFDGLLMRVETSQRGSVVFEFQFDYDAVARLTSTVTIDHVAGRTSRTTYDLSCGP